MSATPLPKFSLYQKIHLFRLGIYSWSIPTHVTSSELMVLHQLSQQIRFDGVIVEIGSYIGASSLIIAKGLPKNAKLYCVDTWQNHAMSEGEKDTFQLFIENTKAVREKITPIRSLSTDAAKNFSPEIDMIFFDGDHSYEGIKSDVDYWIPKVKNNGLVVFHDFGWAEGVKQVVKEDIQPIANKVDELPNMFWAWIKK